VATDAKKEQGNKHHDLFPTTVPSHPTIPIGDPDQEVRGKEAQVCNSATRGQAQNRIEKYGEWGCRSRWCCQTVPKQKQTAVR
jgi:hypothetical protein